MAVTQSTQMTNGEKTNLFLQVIDARSRKAILLAIANHYRITIGEAWEEVTGEGAEALLDYLQEPQRQATSILMQKYKCR